MYISRQVFHMTSKVTKDQFYVRDLLILYKNHDLPSYGQLLILLLTDICVLCTKKCEKS